MKYQPPIGGGGEDLRVDGGGRGVCMDLRVDGSGGGVCIDLRVNESGGGDELRMQVRGFLAKLLGKYCLLETIYADITTKNFIPTFLLSLY